MKKPNLNLFSYRLPVFQMPGPPPGPGATPRRTAELSQMTMNRAVRPFFLQGIQKPGADFQSKVVLGRLDAGQFQYDRTDKNKGKIKIKKSFITGDPTTAGYETTVNINNPAELKAKLQDALRRRRIEKTRRFSVALRTKIPGHTLDAPAAWPPVPNVKIQVQGPYGKPCAVVKYNPDTDAVTIYALKKYNDLPAAPAFRSTVAAGTLGKRLAVFNARNLAGSTIDRQLQKLHVEHRRVSLILKAREWVKMNAGKCPKAEFKIDETNADPERKDRGIRIFAYKKGAKGKANMVSLRLYSDDTKQYQEYVEYTSDGKWLSEESKDSAKTINELLDKMKDEVILHFKPIMTPTAGGAYLDVVDIKDKSKSSLHFQLRIKDIKTLIKSIVDKYDSPKERQDSFFTVIKQYIINHSGSKDIPKIYAREINCDKKSPLSDIFKILYKEEIGNEKDLLKYMKDKKFVGYSSITGGVKHNFKLAKQRARELASKLGYKPKDEQIEGFILEPNGDIISEKDPNASQRVENAFKRLHKKYCHELGVKPHYLRFKDKVGSYGQGWKANLTADELLFFNRNLGYTRMAEVKTMPKKAIKVATPSSPSGTSTPPGVPPSKAPKKPATKPKLTKSPTAKSKKKAI